AAELNPRIAVADLDLDLEHEVAVGLLRGQELVLLQLPLGPPDDLAILDGEQRLVLRRDPTREVLAVEQRAKAAGLGLLTEGARPKRPGRKAGGAKEHQRREDWTHGSNHGRDPYLRPAMGTSAAPSTSPARDGRWRRAADRTRPDAGRLCRCRRGPSITESSR